MPENELTTRNTVSNLNGILQASKIYLITAMVKFPLVISKNGILNGVMSIFLIGGIISSCSNLLLSRISQKTNNTSYMAISENTMGKKTHMYVRTISFLFRCMIVCYSVDLSFRFLSSSSLISSTMQTSRLLPLSILGIVLFLSTLILSNPNSYSFGRSRNTINFLVLCVLTYAFSIKNYKSNIQDVRIENHSKKCFDSLGLTCACFAQQLGLVEILSSETFQSKTSIFCSGILASLGYIIVGVSGYIGMPSPDVNWLSNVENSLIRTPSSLILLLSNIFTFPLQLDPIRREIQSTLFVTSSKSKDIMTNLLLTLAFILTSIEFVASKYGIICCVILSSFITMIFPSVFYLKTFERNTLQAYGLLAVGILTLFVGLRNLINAHIQ
ncbi:uncharacterized protein VICG_01913 [Vittaforma corneae ATCC 50505]|uniref:Amino acid transporter transmembrane domain-containing protein n=1 Tax=Vittaforma corneae (strain ATCC 50505) TaxID=993615 RepID=L2GJJ5_VITCO|nr:uncharacterized protein VICG_01913 [Vittaforma corneae ATCC 50505]ELA41031.1 hypothetical protein VICG_01913 [Vittaforma corneae ATCC 50505]